MTDNQSQIREKIIGRINEELRYHKFSENSYPREVKIETRYDDSRSTLTITFEEENA